MAKSTLGQSLIPALHSWRKLVRDGPTGPGINFSETNRTRLCNARFDSFLEHPSKETFRELWKDETLADYWAPNAHSLLSSDQAVEQLHTLLSEMDDADEFQPEWVQYLGGNSTGWGLYELFARLQDGHDPIPSTEAKEVLEGLGYDVAYDPDVISEHIRDFKETYETHAGHASAGTEYELPIYAEIDEFFRLIDSLEREIINAQLTGEYAPLFRPLIGHSIHKDTADPIQWSGVEALIEDHVEARDSGAYDNLEESHWGGTHIESWKWQFQDYFETVVWSEFELTALTAEDVLALFEAIEEPTEDFDAVSNVPAQMMGGQFHRLAWNDIVDYCHQNPVEAAAVLSDLFDDELPIVDRLNEFYEFVHHLTVQDENDRSPGSLLRAATALLMYAYPQQYIAFQYERMDRFFSEYSNSDRLDTGFNAQQYREVALACRDLLEMVETKAGEASMIDVQTLIYVADDR
ncbi:hypothetical protein [Halovenus halobia]|uniref:hypothetical protein n=1 Tax=Halovenus halobia TaxID=3396622 RepID=UPI003F56CCFA